jgi:hypothetical protein
VAELEYLKDTLHARLAELTEDAEREVGELIRPISQDGSNPVLLAIPEVIDGLSRDLVLLRQDRR